MDRKSRQASHSRAQQWMACLLRDQAFAYGGTYSQSKGGPSRPENWVRSEELAVLDEYGSSVTISFVFGCENRSSHLPIVVLSTISPQTTFGARVTRGTSSLCPRFHWGGYGNA
jgi:hypothetical protein